MGPESGISVSLKNLKPKKIGLWAKFNRHIHVLVIPKFGEHNRSQKGRSALGSNDHPINTAKFDRNNTLYSFQTLTTFLSSKFLPCGNLNSEVFHYLDSTRVTKVSFFLLFLNPVLAGTAVVNIPLHGCRIYVISSSGSLPLGLVLQSLVQWSREQCYQSYVIAAVKDRILSRIVWSHSPILSLPLSTPFKCSFTFLSTSKIFFILSRNFVLSFFPYYYN